MIDRIANNVFRVTTASAVTYARFHFELESIELSDGDTLLSFSENMEYSYVGQTIEPDFVMLYART